MASSLRAALKVSSDARDVRIGAAAGGRRVVSRGLRAAGDDASPAPRGTIRLMTHPCVTVARGPEDVILRDGSTLRLRVAAAGRRARADRVPRRPVARTAATCGSTASTLIDERTVAAALEPGLAGARLAARRARRRRRRRDDRSRSRRTFASATRGGRRSRSPSTTSCRAAGSATRLLERLADHAASAGIEEFVAEVLPQNTRCCGSSTMRASQSHATFQSGVVEVVLR